LSDDLSSRMILPLSDDLSSRMILPSHKNILQMTQGHTSGRTTFQGAGHRQQRRYHRPLTPLNCDTSPNTNPTVPICEHAGQLCINLRAKYRHLRAFFRARTNIGGHFLCMVAVIFETRDLERPLHGAEGRHQASIIGCQSPIAARP
ncbi:hypothetical protein, partial [Methylobacterium sp. Leaf100]|uniref:hypothetical protein n=1 Tax=Methylobacterium sp. Leaf100 TaxID=1736252 RepID=UPI001AEBDEAB